MILRYTTNYEFQSLGACVLGTVRLRAQPTSEEAAPVGRSTSVSGGILEHLAVKQGQLRLLC